MKLLNATQRKYLEDRARKHARELYPSRHCEEEDVPPEVAKARKIIEEWREAEDAKREKVCDKINRELKDVIEGLMFDDQESAVRQVQDFEAMEISDFEITAH